MMMSSLRIYLLDIIGREFQFQFRILDFGNWKLEIGNWNLEFGFDPTSLLLVAVNVDESHAKIW